MNGQRMRPQDLPQLLGVPLSPEQLAAAAADLAPGLIVAGAGSGKTTVMAARVVWLVGTGQVSSAGVLGLTFTNKAAAELLHRIRSSLRKLGPAVAATADDAVVSTYHSFAGALLREFGLLIGVEPSAELMSAVRQRQIAFRVAAGADVDPAHASSPHDLAAAIVSLDSLLADNDVPVEALVDFDDALIAELSSRPQQRVGERMLATAGARRQLAALVDAYRGVKRERELLDFADYVRLGAQTARQHAHVGEQLRQRHPSVLLDEYQDTSVAQRTMLQALFAGGHPVTAVGDPFQAIYGWRGASPYNMDGFPGHFPNSDGTPARVYTLATNRRSGSVILDLANRVARPLQSVHSEVVQLEPDPRNGTGTVVAALLPTVADEMLWLVEQVRGSHRPWQDIAILARTNDAATEAVAALRAAAIPVQVHGKQALLALPEVRWITWALRLVADPAANDAMVGLLMGPPWRIGQRDMALLGRRAADLAARGMPRAQPAPDGPPPSPGTDLLAALSVDPLDGACLMDALFDLGDPENYPYSASARVRFATAAGLLRGWQRKGVGAVVDLVRAVAVESGLAVELGLGPLGGAPGGPPDDSGLVAMVDLARRFDDADRGRTLTDFLSWLQIAETLPDGPEAPAPPVGDAVTVMTVHASKGLEFPVVVLPGLVDGAFPSERGRSTWPGNAGALPFALLSEPLPDPMRLFPADGAQPRASEFDAFSAACRAADRVEETRLAYVAVTRARQHLIMSGHIWGRTQRRPRKAGPYLLAAADAAADGAGVDLDVWSLPPQEDADNPLLVAAAQGSHPQAAAQTTDWAALAERLADTAGARDDPSAAQAAARWDREVAMVRAEHAARRAVLQVTAPTDMSVSGWLAMAKDPAAFALQLARPVPLPVVSASGAGEEFHDWVADQSGQLSLWETDDLIDVELDREASAQQQALRAAFASSPFGPRVPQAVEHPISMLVGDRLVRGRIDAVYVIDGLHWLVDWKTGAVGRADPLQLAVYRAAWAQQRGLEPEQVVGCFVYVAARRYDVYRELPDLAGLQALAAGGSVGPNALKATQQYRWDG